ncbi:MAG TPA: DedA family protein [Stellaceae bacterium]|jgi:membrane protein DedA with SNARE-associated domain|nr:DedA family protein [Stellaceae bacterium]
MNFVEHVRHFVADYGYLAVFLGIFFEDFGLPTPGETMLIAGAVLASHGTLNIYWLLLVAWTGAIAGDSIGYVIGAKGGNRLLTRYGARIGITEARLKKVEAFFARYGDIVVVFARFFLILRQFNGIVAGTLEMPWPRFLVYNAIGAALWVGFWGGATYWIGRQFFEYLRSFGWTGRTVLAIVALGVVVLAAQLWSRWRARHPAEAAATAGTKTINEKQ